MANTGTVVSKPASALLMPVLAWMLSSKGPMAARMGRRFKPSRMMAATSRAEEAEEEGEAAGRADGMG